jgi:hypothetical protein
MMMRVLQPTGLVILALLVGGCDILDPGERRVPGIVQVEAHAMEASLDPAANEGRWGWPDEEGWEWEDWYDNSQPVLEAPDTVLAGVPFSIVVRTHGGGPIIRGGAEVRAASGGVEVRPWDVDVGGGHDSFWRLPRRVSIVFNEKGAGLLTVSGRAVHRGDGGVSVDTRAVIEKWIVVE